MARLRISHRDRTWTVPLGSVTTLGRDPANSVPIQDSFVAKRHAEIRRTIGNRFEIHDLKSNNGTYVRGHRVESVILRDGDEIRVGAARAVFELCAATTTGEVNVVCVTMDDAAAEFRDVGSKSGYLPHEQVDDSGKLRLPYEKLRIANELARSAPPTNEIDHLLRYMLDSSLELFHADRGAAVLIDPLTGSPRRQFARRRGDDLGASITLPRAVLDRVVKEGCGMLVGDLSRYNPAPASGAARSIVCAPMIHHGTTHGILYLDGAQPLMFDTEDLEILAGVANQTAVWVSTAQLTERVQELENLQRVRIEGVIATLPDGVLLVDQSLHVKLANRRAHELMELLAPDFDGKTLTHLADVPSDRIVKRALTEPVEVTIHEPSKRIFRCTAAEVAMHGGGEPETAVIISEITEERAQQSMSEHQERLAVVGRLAAGVAHEINNPLTCVLANLDFVQQDLAEVQGDVGEAIVEACEGAERIRLIVSDLQVFSRADRDRVRPIALERVLQPATNMIFNEVRHRATLVTDYRATQSAMANNAELGQVFLNLLLNAAQALHVGDSERDTITVSTFDDGDRVVAEIRDTGPGIPPEIRARVFDPFFTTKPVGDGSGLGLFVAHRMITSMGGTIELANASGGGTVARVTLPSDAPAQPEPPAEPATVEGPRKPRILIVDDEPMVLRSLKRSMRAADITTTTDGLEALELLKHARFDLVLCDLMMPDLTGMEIHARLRDSSPQLANNVVFMTGGAFTPEAQQFLDEVDNLRFDKPIQRAALASLLALAQPADEQD